MWFLRASIVYASKHRLCQAAFKLYFKSNINQQLQSAGPIKRPAAQSIICPVLFRKLFERGFSITSLHSKANAETVMTCFLKSCFCGRLSFLLFSKGLLLKV